MSVLSAATQRLVESKLVAGKDITKEKLESIRKKATSSETPVFGLLISEGIVTQERLTQLIAEATNVPYVNLSEAKIDPSILLLVPQEVAERYMAVPLGEMGGKLAVAMLDSDNVQAADFLASKVGRQLKVFAASEAGIRNVLSQYSTTIGEKVAGVIEKVDSINKAELELASASRSPSSLKRNNIKTIVQDSPISKALSAILEYAAKSRASDVHVEPLEKELRIRCRIDGVLKEIMKLPKSTEAPLVSRIKILSNLKIDEHRIPQDGQFTVQVGASAIDLRIAIAPTVWGEQVVIRLLDKTGTSLQLEDMGYRGRALRIVRDALKQSHGMILTSGPTGSGKTTSMYALIQEVLHESINIVTLEDPVEYKMDGVNQIQVNNEVGLTFASGLRSILRQDPNVVMVGEIRDKETAQLAVQAALTGHLVFSTLHTNSASGILPRLLDMGIEPFLIASTVRTVIGQRLVRRLYPDTKEEYQSDTAETELINQALGKILPENKEGIPAIAEDLGYDDLPLKGEKAYTLYRGKDSPEALNGYRGRMGLYEAFEITDAIQERIINRATSTDIQKVAQSEGMITMHEDGCLKALAGDTTLAEVNRVAAEGNL
jgi:type IV pilus assembly protein PilB